MPVPARSGGGAAQTDRDDAGSGESSAGEALRADGRGDGGDLNAGLDGDAMTVAVIDRACALIRSRYEGRLGRPDGGWAADARGQAAAGRVPRPRLEIDVVALDSHKPRKFSRHLLLQPHVVLPPPALRCACARRRACTGAPPDPAAARAGPAACAACAAGAPPSSSLRVPLPLAGSAHAGELARRVVDSLGPTLAVRKDNGTTGCFIDLCVYSARRPFRLIGSSKRTAAAAAAPALTPNLALTSPRLHGVLRSPTRGADAATIAAQLHATLIVSPDALAVLLRAQGAAPAALPAPLDFVRRTDPSAPSLVAPPPAASSSARGAALVAAAAAALAPRPPHADARGHEARLIAAPHCPDGALAGDDALNSDALAQSPPAHLAAWRAFFSPLTHSPLLDLPPPLSDHPAVRAMAKGGAATPALFRPLARYAEAHFGLNGVRGWSYIRSAYPNERLLHLTSSGRATCRFIGRPHKSHHAILTFDLLGERVWQRCWDGECRVPAPDGRGYLKARHELAGPDCSAWPSWEALHHFEVAAGCCMDEAAGDWPGALPDAGAREHALSRASEGTSLALRADGDRGGGACAAPLVRSSAGEPDGEGRGGRATLDELEPGLGLAPLLPQPVGRPPSVEAPTASGQGRAHWASHAGLGDRTPSELSQGLQQAGGTALLDSQAAEAFVPWGRQRSADEGASSGAAPVLPPGPQHPSDADSPPWTHAAPATEWLGVLDYARRSSGEGGLASFEAEHQKRRARLARMLP